MENYKCKEEMNNHELFNLRMGYYMTGKIINRKIYYKVKDGRL